MALAGEVGELVSELQWLTADETDPSRLSPERTEAIEGEVADVLIYLVQLVAALNIDLESAVKRKMDANRRRFPPGWNPTAPARDSVTS